MRYGVELNRYQTADLYVEAASEDEAEEIVADMLDNDKIDWDSDYPTMEFFPA